MHPMLNIAVRAARRAGSILSRAPPDDARPAARCRRQQHAGPRRGTAFVAPAAHAAEEAVLDVVRKAYPDHAILAEESGVKQGSAEYEWVIDPLDGTTNFIHRFP